jgi:hypothetical protein
MLTWPIPAVRRTAAAAWDDLEIPPETSPSQTMLPESHTESLPLVFGHPMETDHSQMWLWDLNMPR